MTTTEVHTMPDAAGPAPDGSTSAPAPAPGAIAGAVVPALGLAGVAFCFSDALLTYLHDNYYQSHFLFLWLFFAAALYKTTRGRIVAAVAADRRTALGLTLGVWALLGLHAGLVTGSSTVQRCALVLTFAAWAVVAARGFSLTRCAALAGFALLCFGVPYSAYFQVTLLFRHALVAGLAAIPSVVPLPYEVDGLALQFPHYRLAITADCSGFNQLITFGGIAFLGVLTGRPSGKRAALLFVLAVLLAYAANIGRVLVFAMLVSWRQYTFIANENLHQLTGFVAYAPFILLFVWVVLKTHRPLAPPVSLQGARGKIPVVAFLLPLLCVRLLNVGGAEPSDTAPPYMAGLDAPPGCRLVQRSTGEVRERATYDTPFLVNTIFAAADGETFELFAYLTRSQRHLAVHQISNCLEIRGTRVRYGPPVVVEGRTFWTLELNKGGVYHHGYFAFWVDGQDRDDKFGTQLAVFLQRLTHGVKEVGVTRFLMPGRLQSPLPTRDRALLTWRARQLNALTSDS